MGVAWEGLGLYQVHPPGEQAGGVAPGGVWLRGRGPAGGECVLDINLHKWVQRWEVRVGGPRDIALYTRGGKGVLVKGLIKHKLERANGVWFQYLMTIAKLYQWPTAL